MNGHLLMFPLAMLATTGFAVLFNAPRRTLGLYAIMGAAAWLARELMLGLGASPALANLAGGLVIGSISELGARRFQAPALIFLVAGFVPLIPGVLAYQAIVHALNADYVAALSSAIRTALLAGALAIGIAFVRGIARVRRAAAR